MIAVTLATIIVLGVTLRYATSREHVEPVRLPQPRIFDQDSTQAIIDELAHLRRANRPAGYRRCGFCGTHCYGKACAAHRDVAQLDRGTAHG